MTKLNGVVSHHEREIAELSSDRELAVEYLKVAMESLSNPTDHITGLLALSALVGAYGDLALVTNQ